MDGMVMGLQEVLRALRHSWWLLVAGVLVGGGAGLAISAAQAEEYTSNTQIFVSTAESESTSDIYQGSQFSQQRVSSYATLISGEALAQRVIGRLSLDMTPEDLADQIVAQALTDTVLIDISVSDSSPVTAQRVAEAVGSEFADFAQELEATSSAGSSPVRVTVTDEADLPSSPSSPKTARNLALGLLTGLLLGASVAIARIQLDRSVRTAEQVQEFAGAPLVGVIPQDEVLANEHKLERNGHGRAAEAYRQLRTNLQFLHVDEPPRVIMVSSAVPTEGKTTVSVNLASTLAESGRTVALVEGDLRRPRVIRYLGMVGGAGLTNILGGSAALDDVLQTYGESGLHIVAAGPTPPNPSELLASTRMATLIDDLRGRFDFVLIDAPPLLPVADASGLAVLVDGVVLSVRYAKTRKDQLRTARETLDRVGARTLGAVINVVPSSADLAGSYGYGQDYGYDSERKRRHGARAKGDE